MADPRYVQFRPRWWKSGMANSRLADTPSTGFEPQSAPRLPTRILPKGGGSALSAATLSDAITCTQRILRYVSYEVVHGVHPDFGDLRSAETEVLDLAKLSVEPFEEGSFIIPASLPEIEVKIGGKTFSSWEVLERFVEVMTRIYDPQFPASIGLVQAIEELGKITRREADSIEFYPKGMRQEMVTKVTVDENYIAAVAESRRERRHFSKKPDILTGIITAVDLVRASFNLLLEDQMTVRGNFELFVSEEQRARALNAKVQVEGVVEFINNQPTYVRAFTLAILD